MSPDDNDHPSIVVVGASRGIGRDVAERLLKAHPKRGEVVATMRQPDPSQLPDDAQIDHLDMTNEDSVKECASHYKSVGTLIVNAAMGEDDKLTEIDSDKFRKYIETNVIGMHHVIRHFLPLLRNGKDKNIIIMASSAGSLSKNVEKPSAMSGPYSVTKAAGLMYGVQLHHELKEDGFFIGLLHPGTARSEMGKAATDHGQKEGVDYPQPIEESAEGVVDLVKRIRTFESPAFLNWKGEAMKW